MKKPRIALAAALLLCAQAAFAADFGLDLEDLTSWYGSNGSGWVQKNRASLWFSTPLSPSFDLSMSLWYDFSYRAGTVTAIEPYLFDCGDLALTYYGEVAEGGTSWFKAKFGRFAWAESTGMIFNSRIDGVSVLWQEGNTIVTGMLGYTGLFPFYTMPIFLSADDTLAFENHSQYLSSSRVALYGTARFVELFLRQDLMLDLGMQFDAHLNPVDPIHTQYLSVAVQGPLATGIYQKSFAVLGLGESAGGFNLSALVGFDLTAFVPSFAGFQADLNFLYASGGQALFSSFRPIVQSHLGFAFDAPLGNNLLTSLTFAFQPAEWLAIGAKGILFCRSSTVQIDDDEFLAGSQSLYLGTEAQAFMQLSLASDFKIDIQGGVFFPNSGDTFVAAAQPRPLVAAFATLKI